METLMSPDIRAAAPGNQTEELEHRFFQPIWDFLMGYPDQITSPLFPIISSVLFYFFAVIPWMMLDLFAKDWKWVQKHKIQPDKEVTWPLVRKAIVLTFWNHLLYILPISIAQWMWQPPFQLPKQAPTVLEWAWHLMASLAIFDFEYFVWHAVHHKIRFLYRHVHSVHHQYSSPNSWVTQYLHPWELISVGIFTTTSPWLFGAHPLTELTFQQFAIIVSVEAHIGYDFPIMPYHWFPFWGGNCKHDMHHQRPLTNFAPFFNYWDMIFGWYCPGQEAGGYKPKALLDYEKKEQEERIKARQAREKAKSKAKNGVQNGSGQRNGVANGKQH